jgi:hypothetical protein
MTNPNDQNDRADVEAHVRNIIEAGSSITGSAAGSAIGFFLGGPAGATVGGAAGAYFSYALRRIGDEFHGRYLAPREKIRIGATLDMATRQIRQRLERGERLRDDGFFEKSGSDRSEAEEVLEGVLTTAQRAYEERKLIYLSNLISSISFDKGFSRDRANYIISLANRFTYQQYVVLSVLGLDEITKGSFSLRDKPWSGEINRFNPLAFTISQIMDLVRLVVLQVEGRVVIGLSDIIPAKLKITGVGAWLWNGMKLAKLRDRDPNEFDLILKILKDAD